MEKNERVEEFVKMSLRMKKIQDDVLNDYFSTPAVIRFNYLEHIRTITKERKVSTLDEFTQVMEKEIQIMKEAAKVRAFTKIEKLEFRLAKKIVQDVILGQGEEFSFGKDLIYHYDDQEIKAEEILETE